MAGNYRIPKWVNIQLRWGHIDIHVDHPPNSTGGYNCIKRQTDGWTDRQTDMHNENFSGEKFYTFRTLIMKEPQVLPLNLTRNT